MTASVQWTPAPSCCHHHRLCDAHPLTSGHTSSFAIARYDAPVTNGGRCALSIHRILSIESPTSAAQTSPSSNRLMSRWKAHGFGIRCLLVMLNLRMKRRQRTVVLLNAACFIIKIFYCFVNGEYFRQDHLDGDLAILLNKYRKNTQNVATILR